MASLLLPNMLELLGTTTPQLLAIGLHTAALVPATRVFPISILLIQAWPQCILPLTTVVFFDSSGQQFLTIEDIYVSSQHASSHPLISLSDYHTGDRPPLRHSGTLDNHTPIKGPNSIVSAHHRKSHCRTCIQFSKTSKGHTGTTPHSQPTRCYPHCSLTSLWANNRLANLQLLHL